MDSCDLCRGACCEFVVIERLLQLDHQWWAYHSSGILSNGDVGIEARCHHLTEEGRCRVYEKRPLSCQEISIGDPDCIEAIRFRRKPLEAERIIAALGK